MPNLQGKVALVTGATRGIGKGIAIGLGEAGATVYVTGRSVNSSSPISPNSEPSPNPQTSTSVSSLPGSLGETQAAVEAAGGICIPVTVDHGDDRQVQSLFERIGDENQGQLDLLVNNVYGGVRALRQAYGQPFWQGDASVADAVNLWDQVNNVGLRSHYVASILGARLMTPRKQGLICTISSWGSLYYLFGAAYGAGKAACDRLAADMATDLKPHQVASVSLWPGIVGTENIQAFVVETGAETGLATGTVETQVQTFSPTSQANQNQNRQASAIQQQFNWETPVLTGRAIAALAQEDKILDQTGRVLIVAELAQRYGLVDQEGNRPASLRSLRFIVPYLLPALRSYPNLVPDLKIPWPLLLLGALRSPKI
jgi:NAD(P)-dependent dehydrogenase (short-subunit alcohol dehydrogenase family)